MEPSLAIAFAELTGSIGFDLGFGRGADNDDTTWAPEQQAIVTAATKGGMREFYFCGYDWSFLHPVATLTLLSGESTVNLPADFGGPEGKLVVSLAGGARVCVMDFGQVGRVLVQQVAQPDTTGVPQVVCEEPIKTTSKLKGQRHRLRVWPVADQDYTLTFAYYINPNYLSGQFPYAYGGPQHAETLLAACLAYNEQVLDNVKDGPHKARFEERLVKSRAIDARQKPQHLGYNRDHSDGRDVFWDSRHRWPEVVTFDGVTPG